MPKALTAPSHAAYARLNSPRLNQPPHIHPPNQSWLQDPTQQWRKNPPQFCNCARSGSAILFNFGVQKIWQPTTTNRDTSICCALAIYLRLQTSPAPSAVLATRPALDTKRKRHRVALPHALPIWSVLEIQVRHI